MPDGAACSSWDFDTSTYGRTMTSEFQLVCDRRFLRPAYNSIFFFGSFFSCALAGWISDRLGRKRVISCGVVVFAVLANSVSWLPNMTSVLAIRFILGFCHPFCVQIGYSLVLEVFEERWRAAAGILIFLPWTVGTMILSGVAHLTRDWRWTSFILSIPLLLLLPVLRVLDESPRWLIVRGRHEEAVKVLQKAARWNNASLPPASDLRVLMEEIEHEASSRNRKQSGGVRASLRRFAAELTVLVRTRNMRTITLIAYCILMICSMCYVGLSLGGDIFSSNPYVYMALSGLMEIPGGTLTIPLVQRFGRRPCNIVLLFLTGASLLALTFVPNSIFWLATLLALAGKLTLSASYQVAHLHCTELYPTEVRTWGMGTSTMLDRIGSVFASFLVDNLRTVWANATSVVFGCASILASAVTFLLPETKGAALHDTIASLEASGYRRKRSVEGGRDKEPGSEAEMMMPSTQP